MLFGHLLAHPSVSVGRAFAVNNIAANNVRHSADRFTLNFDSNDREFSELLQHWKGDLENA